MLGKFFEGENSRSRSRELVAEIKRKVKPYIIHTDVYRNCNRVCVHVMPIVVQLEYGTYCPDDLIAAEDARGKKIVCVYIYLYIIPVSYKNGEKNRIKLRV